MKIDSGSLDSQQVNVFMAWTRSKERKYDWRVLGRLCLVFKAISEWDYLVNECPWRREEGRQLSQGHCNLKGQQGRALTVQTGRTGKSEHEDIPVDRSRKNLRWRV